MVHGDYTLTSAPQRLSDLADSPKSNDTLISMLGAEPLVPRYCSSGNSRRETFWNY
ncbi:MAG: hypothetical protein CM1200mP24_09320 [Gammaproteobacteria bacterium]|nr:MAG: hypothetical protein CM1200mP24_09320 [Gammaproteobacteria bacterium]